MSLRDRIGVDLGRKVRLEEGIEWAAKNGVKFIDVQLDTAENALTTFDAKRCTAVRKQLNKRRIKLGLHTNAFGSLGDMLAGRDYLVDRAREAGVEVG